ncbi:hypothetical protein FA13DRAFT_1691398 [Coprinellus micaceus]|uniref:N-acetyltransferase domain-containing protein n=1 Tax=Coprinellus micaceus TaxID=71717 RepID=A0A4Y7T1J0_COPMI|nr:hypothetical protein FA13DRAFT_1691398 [Coprinellus micaceus]
MSAPSPPPIVGKDFSFRVIDADQTVALRHLVLWPDAPISHVLLPEDDTGIHIGAFIPSAGNQVPVAVISLFQQPLPIDNDAEAPTAEPGEAVPATPETVSSTSEPHKVAVRFRKFACDPCRQGQGIGSALLDYSATLAREKLATSVIWCDARISTAPWYQKRGFLPFGKTFYKSDVEYIRMKRSV